MTIVPWKRRPRDPATSGRLPQVPSKTTAIASDGPLSLGRYHDGTESVPGLNLSELEPHALLELQTDGSRYRIMVRDPSCGSVLIQGGRCFPRYTTVRLRGTGIGADPVTTGWIGLGSSVEILWDDLRIITGPVHAIRRRLRPAQRGLTDQLAA